MDHLTKAERQIEQILAQLERDSGSVVERVGIEDIEITQLESTRKELARRVRIDLATLPGTRWAEG